MHTGDKKPLSKVYVKVFADVNGTPTFYKNGYTDLRGKFDYASPGPATSTAPPASPSSS